MILSENTEIKLTFVVSSRQLIALEFAPDCGIMTPTEPKKKMSYTQNFEVSGARVLFFGRDKCNSSKKLLYKLKRYGFDITYVESKERYEKLPEDILLWEGDYILCFRSFFILPKAVIKKAKVAAINFHPAPPEYPGSGCINFALYEEVNQYGVTAHIMNEKIDNGEILEVRRFPVSKIDNLSTVLSRAHSELFNLCSDFIYLLYEKGSSIIDKKKMLSKEESWKGDAKLMRDLEYLKNISPKITEKELRRVIRATYIEEFPPKIELYGYKFYLKLDE